MVKDQPAVLFTLFVFNFQLKLLFETFPGKTMFVT